MYIEGVVRQVYKSRKGNIVVQIQVANDVFPDVVDIVNVVYPEDVYRKNNLRFERGKVAKINISLPRFVFGVDGG